MGSCQILNRTLADTSNTANQLFLRLHFLQETQSRKIKIIKINAKH